MRNDMLFRADGSYRELRPRNLKRYTPAEISQYVGGEYDTLEITFDDGQKMVMYQTTDLSRPVNNFASQVMFSFCDRCDIPAVAVFGDVVIVKDSHAVVGEEVEE